MSLTNCRVFGLASFVALLTGTLSSMEASAAGPPPEGQLWTRTISTPGIDYAGGVGADQLGNLYLTGDVSGQLAVPPGGGYDSFVAKYSPNGNQVWLHLFGTSSYEFSTGIAVSPAGDFVVSGSYDSAIGGPSLGLTDGFVRKYNADGVAQWTTLVGSDLIDNVVDVALSATGDSFVAGYSYNLFPYRGNGFVSKLSATGAIAWTRTVDATLGVASAYGVAVDSLGASFVVGQSGLKSPLIGSSESGAAFVTKFDISGNLLWTRQFGDDYAASARDVAVDSLGNAFVVGQGFVRKLAADGSFLWDHQLHSAVSVTDISLDGLGRVLVGGSWDSVPFYGIYSEDGVPLSIRLLPFESGYASNIAADGFGNVFISQTMQVSNSFDIQLWKLAYIPEPNSLALAATGLLVVVRSRNSRR